ncbi:LOW QUALITY PROTEIN: cytoplasmic dynein 2 heavy chain 1 [Manduca sexta]|uniref:LOW QUALITY PROTEIN: cytoplasmic dynein 2 heavy chain 1 n=1 Tax=Manduca sexta TaxID=7130 RepID=UPI00188F0FEB|nr:LOW QUALITY PROTEIN: cytoplasmic dynein 2 heavy chain 1 [Manduca sexta]
MSALSTGLESVSERVAALKEQLGRHTRDAAALELRLGDVTRTIAAATHMLRQLAHEYRRWELDLENISKEISELNTRSLLAAAYIVYLPDVTEPEARDYLKMWSDLIGYEDDGFSVINFLSTTEKQLKWDADGLSSDTSAIKNAIFIDQFLESHKCGFTPLIVDPDGDGIAWLKNTLSHLPCDVVSQSSSTLLTAVQYAVRLNRILIVTDVDRVHESWSALLFGLPLSGAAGGAHARLVLHCRDETLPARLPAHYTARISTLYFTARLDGLTDQLIYYALQHHNPEVNEKAKEIKANKAVLQKQQHELQESLLQNLSGKTDILHDPQLAESLEAARETSNTISAALEAARDVHLAQRGALAAYSASARGRRLALRSPCARLRSWPRAALPTDALLHIYAEATKASGKQSDVDTEVVVKLVTRKVIERVVLGLYKKDKYIIILHLLKEVYGDLITNKLWQLFIGNNEVADDIHKINEVKKSYSWIPDDCIKNVVKLKVSSEDLFDKLSLNNEKMWKEFMQSGDLNINLENWELSSFETVITVALIRPDSLYGAVVAFVNQVLVQIAALHRPIVLLCSISFDYQVGVEEGRAAWESALETSRGGGWLVLLVGASPFTPDLQSFLTSVTEAPSEQFNEDFRLWIVCEDREVPPLISSACVNVILEPPEGVKNNVMNTLSAWNGYEDDPEKVRAHATLALFHAIVQERRAYIPQGWSRWYAWEWGEAAASARALREGGARAGAALCTSLYAARVSEPADYALLHALHARAHDATPAEPHQHTRALKSYIAAFDNTPNMDSPQMLGLPANCRIAWERNAANHIISGLKELNSTISVNRNGDNVAQLKSLLALWRKLMTGSPLIKGDYSLEKERERGWCGWWRSACGAEVAQAARAARLLHGACAALAPPPRAPQHSHAQGMHYIHVSHGQPITNQTLPGFGNRVKDPRKDLPLEASLIQVPEEWQLLWPGPETPETYIKEFCYRAHAAVARLEACNDDPDFMPAELELRSWLSARRVCGARARRRQRLARAPHLLGLRALPAETPRNS